MSKTTYLKLSFYVRSLETAECERGENLVTVLSLQRIWRSNTNVPNLCLLILKMQKMDYVLFKFPFFLKKIKLLFIEM